MQTTEQALRIPERSLVRIIQPASFKLTKVLWWRLGIWLTQGLAKEDFVAFLVVTKVTIEYLKVSVEPIRTGHPAT